MTAKEKAKQVSDKLDAAADSAGGSLWSVVKESPYTWAIEAVIVGLAFYGAYRLVW